MEFLKKLFGKEKVTPEKLAETKKRSEAFEKMMDSMSDKKKEDKPSE